MSREARHHLRPGRDRRAELQLAPAPTGRPVAAARKRVCVVGGGIAGLAAATALAERGVQVSLLERQPQLGGRVAAWQTRLGDGSPVTMSRGFHAFFRQYYNLRSLLSRADPGLGRLRPAGDYPLLAGDGTTDSFTGIPTTPPWNVLGFVAKSPSFTVSELVKVNVAAALELLQVDFPRTFSDYDGVSAAEFLDRLRFPSRARHLSLEVFARSFFADPRDFSAGELVGMFHTYFLGSAEGLPFDVPDDDYHTALWAPMARYLHSRGVEIRCGAAVADVQQRGDRLAVVLEDGEIDCEAVVLALDRAALQGLVREASWLGEGSEAGGGWRDRLAAAELAPPFAVLRIWFDRAVADGTPAFLGTSGCGPLDNVSVLNLFEAGAASWARASGGSVVEVHSYAIPSRYSAPELGEALRHELFRIHPELDPVTGPARVVDERWLLAQDCPLIGTDPWLDRPGVATPDPRVMLAGDGIRCELPVALMERAATTGFQAANRLLSRWGLAGHDLWSAPMRGLLARRRPPSPA